MGAFPLTPGTILLITQAFPPEPLVGAFRSGNVARAYRDAGYRVIVVTATTAGERPGLREWLPGVDVHTIALGPRYRERLTRLLRRLQIRPSALFSRNGASGTAGTDSKAPASGGLRALLLSLVWIPDDELRFVLPAYKTARRLLRENAVDLVYTSAPSHSTNLVGLLLRRLHGRRWCAEFRDPWAYANSAAVTPFVKRANEYLERLCVTAADELVTVTDLTAELYRQRLGESAQKVLVVRNGIPVMSPRPSRPADAPFRIVYSGSIYGGRDPRAFLQAVAEVSRETDVPLVVDIFVGEARSAGDVSLEASIESMGLGDIVFVRDWVPHAEIQRVLRESDLLLLLAQRQPLQVPNKLYEYLGTGVPILAIADQEGETARMLRQVGGHYVVAQDDVEEIAAALRLAIQSRGAAASGNTAVLEEWSTARQMARLVQLVKPVHASAPSRDPVSHPWD
jgi:glycosyltransferase involved in cell wall biosynthesis